MGTFIKKHKFLAESLVITIVTIIVFAAIMPIYRFFKEGTMSTEEWSVMMLTDYREDVEAAIADIEARQKQGVTAAYVHQYADEPPEISLTYPTHHETETLEYNQLYHRLMKKCMRITLHPSGVISFSRRGFLTGYSGFYYSPTGLTANVEGSQGADWYETDWLEGNYFYYAFGY